MRRRYLVVCLFFLLVISSIGPLSFGSKLSENTNVVENHSNIQPLDGPMDSPWPMFGHDSRHTGRSPYSTAYNPGRIKWKFETEWLVETSPIIDKNNTIYVASWNHLFAIYPNGTEKWHWDYNELEASSPALADDGTVYIGSNDGKLFAINPNGTTKWVFQGNDGIKCAPTIDNDGIIYFSTFAENGKFYAVNPNGTEKWYYDADFYCQKSPAIADDGTIYFNSHVYLYAFYTNGTLKWKLKLGDPNFTFLGGPSVGDDGIIYIPCDPSYLYAVNPNGTIKWRSYTEWGSWAAPSIGLDGTIYIGYKHMFAFYPNGTLKWVFIPDGDEWHSIDSTTYAISSDGTIYIGTRKDGQNCYIFALNLNGTEKWRQWISNERVLSAPAIAEDGTVYIGVTMNPDEENMGILYAFGIGYYEAEANGPYYGLTAIPIQFQGEVSNGTEPYHFHWGFGDGNTSDAQNPQFTYTKPGNYSVTLTVTDKNNNITNDTSWAWVQTTNSAPEKPVVIGPNTGKREIGHTFKFSTVDPDDSIVYYYIDWGDLTNTGWIGPYESGEQFNKTHKWNLKMKFTIQVKAKDPYGAESDWTSFDIGLSDIWLRISFKLFFATIIVRNTGLYDLYDVPWEIRTYEGIGGTIFYKSKNVQGTIHCLKALSAERIRIIIIGYGPVEVDMFVYNEKVAKEVWMLGPIFIPTFD